MLLLALIVAGCAGYFSVWGLSQLFAGASTAVIIMASTLEIGKVVATTALHRYWDKIAGGLKFYLTISVGVLMLITSAGIYGFLSNAYQRTANKLEIQESQASVLDSKKVLFEKSVTDNQKIIDSKSKRIDQLTNLRNAQETRLDNATSNRARDKARNDIKLANEEIQKLSNEIDGLNVKNSVLSDSISMYSTKSIELTANSEVSAEVGPLKYISELTGAPMGKVVNILILLLIFVFDPLAIAMILMTNRIFELEGDVNPLEIKKKVEPKPDSILKMIASKETESNFAEPTMLDEQDEEYYELEETIEPTSVEPKDREPVIPTGKIQLEDIREIKNRGFSVDVPNPKKNNVVERIGTNKVVKNGDNNKVYYRKN
jgi:hypothetical protein